MKNESGIYPVGYKCLVLLPPRKEKDEKGLRKSDSGLVYISEKEDREEEAEMIGTFIAAGGIAFTGDETSEAWPKDNQPKPGAKILYDKYAGGNTRKGMDGKEYRLINDREIGAIVEEDYVG